MRIFFGFALVNGIFQSFQIGEPPQSLRVGIVDVKVSNVSPFAFQRKPNR